MRMFFKEGILGNTDGVISFIIDYHDMHGKPVLFNGLKFLQIHLETTLARNPMGEVE